MLIRSAPRSRTRLRSASVRQAGPAADWAATVQEAVSVSAELAQAAMDYLALLVSIE
jgi:hypothetical protein